jgi:hypothetical protein
VSEFAASVVPWLHPALGLLAVAVLLRAAARGSALRERKRPSPRHLPHPTLAAIAWLLVALNWGLGLVTVRFFRPELTVADSTHFQAGTALLVVLTMAGMASRWIHRDPRGRRIHPAIGAVALLLAGVQVFLGLQMTRW